MALTIESREYRIIAVDTLQPNRVPPIDLYIQREEDEVPLLFRSRTLPVDRDVIRALNEHHIDNLLVTIEDFESYEAYLNRYLLSIIHDTAVPIESKCDTTYNLSSQLMQRVYESSNPADVVKASSQVVNMVIDVIFQDEKAAHNFLIRTSMDYALYTHSVNVCLLGVSLARRALGISKQDALSRFGPWFLLHDIGLSTLPPEMYKNIDPLDSNLSKEYREHPIKSLELVKEFMDVNQEGESIILQHHEHIDGSGYPVGLRGKDISVGARICALADTFDILNTQTEFRERKPSFVALKEIRKFIPSRYDERLFKEFLFMFIPPKS